MYYSNLNKYFMIFLLFITKLLINWIPSYYFQTKYYNFKIPDFTYIYRKKWNKKGINL